jgi:hypothetical protein
MRLSSPTVDLTYLAAGWPWPWRAGTGARSSGSWGAIGQVLGLVELPLGGIDVVCAEDALQDGGHRLDVRQIRQMLSQCLQC